MRNIFIHIKSDGTAYGDIKAGQQNENNATTLIVEHDAGFDDFNKYIDFAVGGTKFRSVLQTSTNHIFNYSLPENLCTGVLNFQFVFINAIDGVKDCTVKSQVLSLSFNESINAMEFIDITSVDILNEHENRISALEVNIEHISIPNLSIYDEHLSNTANPHHVTKAQINLGNVDNTSDEDKPISAAVMTALDGKQSALGYVPEDIANKNQNNGYCGLDQGGKVPLANLPSTLLNWIGCWDPTTNSPELISPDTSKSSWAYNVSADGNMFDIEFKRGDWLIYNSDGIPERSENSDDITSVNGQTGSVYLTQDNIPAGSVYTPYSLIEQSKLAGIAANATYYTDAMADTRISAAFTSQNVTAALGFTPARNNQTFYIGTTQIAINSPSGVNNSINGVSMMTPGSDFYMVHSGVNSFVSKETGAIANTLVIDRGHVQIAGAVYNSSYVLNVTGNIKASSLQLTNNGNITFGHANISESTGSILTLSAGTTPSTILTLTGVNVGVGSITTPLSYIHLPAATSTNASFIINPGTLLSTLKLGAFEITDDGTNGHVYATVNVAGVLTRKTII